jgi:hypothetical protein
MNKAERWAKCQQLNERLRGLGRVGVIKLQMMSSKDALMHDQIQPAALEYLYKAFLTSQGMTDDPLGCYCCDRDWSTDDDVLPLGIVVIEFLDLDGEALLAGFCSDCEAKGEDEVLRAIKRDFPMLEEFRRVAQQEGHT